MTPTSAKSITWLHLSDVHLCKPKTGWDVFRVLRPLLDDLRRMQSEHGLCPDLIFFSGDLAFGNIGTGPGESIADQLEEGHQLLESVRQAFAPAAPQQNVFVVPGNHDVNRRECPNSVTTWLDGIDNVNEITGLIQTTPLDWKHIMLRLADYADFLKRHGYQHLLRDPARLIYSQTRKVSGLTIGIAGLNSAWSCSRDNEKGKLWMGGDWQIGQLTSQLQDVDFRIAVVHHPANWFRENEDPHIWQLMEREFQFCLHGHEHQGWVKHLADGHTRISAAAAYERSGQENGYNFVRIALETCTGEVWLRRYDSAGGGWVPRIVAKKTDNDGCWKLTQLTWLKTLGEQLMTEWPPVPPGSATALTPAVHTPSASQRPLKRDLVYISYSHRDKQWHSKLREVLDKDDRLPLWDDTKIPAGADFEGEIREHISRTRIMIMLVSPDYLSPNCGAAELEIKPALENASKGDINILWIPVRTSAVFQHPIGKLLAAHDPARPLEALDPAAQQKALAGVRERIYGVLGLSSQESFQYDAFVSYRHQEPDKAFAWKLARDLEAAGYRIALDARDFSPQATFLEEMERCIKQSRFTLAVSSPRYFQSGNTNEEAIITKVLDMDERRRRLIPLKIEVTEMPFWMYNIVGIDFTEQQPFVDPIDRLKKALQNP